MSGGRGRVCFFASHLWPSFSEGAIAFAGGAEVQQAALARGLASRDYDVTVVTCDYGQGPRVVREGITFLGSHPPQSGLPVLRFFHPRLTGNVRALLAARADVIYVRGAGMQAGLGHDVARFTRAGFVFAAAHEGDANRALPLVPPGRDRWWASRAIRGADAVIAQTRVQQEGFRREWARESVLLPNLVEMPPQPVDPGGPGAALWLSTYKESKRPDLVLELARRHPELRFVMAGVIPPPPLTRATFERAQAAARAMPNLEVLGHVDRADLERFFARGALLVHTSPSEGFPNTLLEAWAHGLPSVASFDPDGIAVREGLGEVAADTEGLEAAVVRRMADPAWRREAGARARRYVEERHTPGAVVAGLAAILDPVIEAARERRNSA